MHKHNKSCSQLIWPLYRLLQLYELKSENSYLRGFSGKVSQSVFVAYLTVLRLIKIVWSELSENSYLRDFSAKVSQIVFLAYLTVLRLITTVWPEMSENSNFREFSAQVSQIEFLAYLTVLQAYYNCMSGNLRTLVATRFQCTSITNCILRLFDGFTSLLQLYEWKSQKTPISATSMHKYHKSCS